MSKSPQKHLKIISKTPQVITPIHPKTISNHIKVTSKNYLANHIKIIPKHPKSYQNHIKSPQIISKTCQHHLKSPQIISKSTPIKTPLLNHHIWNIWKRISTPKKHVKSPQFTSNHMMNISSPSYELLYQKSYENKNHIKSTPPIYLRSYQTNPKIICVYMKPYQNFIWTSYQKIIWNHISSYEIRPTYITPPDYPP